MSRKVFYWRGYRPHLFAGFERVAKGIGSHPVPGRPGRAFSEFVDEVLVTVCAAQDGAHFQAGSQWYGSLEFDHPSGIQAGTPIPFFRSPYHIADPRRLL